MEQPWRGKGGTMERNPSGSLKSSSQNCSKILGGSSSYQAKSKAGIFIGKQKQGEPRFQCCWSSEEIEQVRRGTESTIERKLSWFLKSSLNCSKTHGETSSSQAKSKAATFMEKQEQREPSSESLRFLRPMELQRKEKGCTMERKPSGFLMSGKNCSKAHEEEKHPAFFKIMIGDFKNVLFIPLKSVGTIGDTVNQTLFLRDLHGHTWRVKLSLVNGHLAFQGGWDDFVMDHSIVAGEFLVFKYIGDSMFKVEIFGISACNRIDFDEKVKKSSTTPKRKANEFPHENIHIRKRQKTCEFSEFRSKVGNRDSVMKRVRKEKISSRKLFGKAINPGKSVIHEKKKVPRKLERASAHAAKSGMLPTPFTSNYAGAPSHVIDEDAGEQEATELCPVPFCEIPCDVVNKKEKNDTDLIDLCSPKLPYLLRSHSSEQKCCKNGLGDLVAHRFLLTKDGVCHIVDENLKDEIGASMLTPNDGLPSEKEKTECHKDKKPSSREHSPRHENVPNIPCTKPIIDLTKVGGGNNRSTSTKIGKKPQGKESSEEINQLRRGKESTIKRKPCWFLKSSLNCSKTHGQTSSSQAKSKYAIFMEKQKQKEPSSESRSHRFLRPMELQRKGIGCTMERKPSGFLMSGKNCLKAHEEEKHSAFFKIMIGDFKNVLFIPPKIVGTIGDLVNQTLFLRDLHGHTWRVKLSVVNGHLAFQGGWDDFVMDHSIVAGEFLVFKYIGDSMFKVKIFGTSACNRIDFDEKVKKSSTTPKRKANEFPHENIHIPKRQKTCEFSEFRRKVDNHDSVMKRVRKEKTSSRKLFGKAFNPGKSVIHEKKKVPRKLERASAHAAKSGMLPAPFTSNYVGAPSHVIDEDAGEQEATRVCPVPFCEIPRDAVNKKEKNNTDLIDLCSPKLPYLLRSDSSEQKCCKNGLGDLVAHRFLLTKDGVCHIVDENLKDEIGASMLTPNDSLPSEKEKTECHKDKKPSSREHSLRHENVSNIPCTKPIIDLTKVEGGNNRSTSTKIGVRPALMHRQDTPLFATGGYTPADMSRIQKHHKRPHTIKRYFRRSEEVKEKVIAPLKRNSIQVKLESLDEKDILPPALANFRFSFSFTAQTSWIVLPGNLPSQFSKMRHARQVIVLRDPSMRLWPVLYHEDSKFVGFIGGWEYFTRANDLRKGDLCRFEGAHLGSEFTLQVQITRA